MFRVEYPFTNSCLTKLLCAVFYSCFVCNHRSYDEAGRVEIPSYDFKGNVLTKNRQVISSATLKAELNNYNTFIIDWTGLPSILDTTDYQTDMAYDALNRITLLTLPEDVSGSRKDIVPSYNRSGALQYVRYDGTGHVENIVYNAKGQRLLIAFKNSVMSRYVYDPMTFRLLRQRSEKYSKSVVGRTITYNYSAGTLRQDDGFNYDLVGNIVKLLDRMKDCGIVSPDALDRNFDYDPIYRLTSADGRESNTQSGDTYLYDDAPVPSGLTDVRAYARTYSYDKLGNVQSVVQSGTNGFTRNFVYNTGKNTLQEINTAAPALIEDYTYDDCGNQLTAASTRNYVWNHADQLICYYNLAGSGNPTIYTQYDYGGQDRVSKLVRTGTAMSPIYERTIYIDGIFEYVKLEDGSTYEKNYIHIMDDKSRIAEIRINIGTAFPGDIANNITYILENQIGSSVMRTDANGTEIDREEYYPFGDSSLRTFTYKRYRYVGKERDTESGLYYYGARYYAAWTCRFISVDPLAAKYNQLTPYNNAGNNPINDKDIDGMQSEKTPSGGDTKTIQAPNPLGNEALPKAADGAQMERTLDEIKVTPKQSGWAKAWGITKSFFKGFAKGFVTGVIIAGGIALAAAAAPVLGVIAGVTALAVGVYSGIKVIKSWNKGEYDTNQKAEIVGEVIGGIFGGRIGAKGGTTLGEKIFTKGKQQSTVTQSNAPEPIMKPTEFIESATQPWGEQGLTVAGRALQKHSGRKGSPFEDVKFSHKTANQDALSIIDNILNSSNKLVRPAERGGYEIFDVNSGRGMGISRSGKFNGFRDYKP